jgi:hypothetical protein
MKLSALIQIINEEVQNLLDPNNLISYIPQGYEHGILDETFKSVNEIKKLANDIIHRIAEKDYKQFERSGFKYIGGISLSEIDSNNYDEIRNFIAEMNLQIFFLPKRGTSITKGEYGGEETKKGEKYEPKNERDINIYYNYERTKKLFDELISEKGENLEEYDIYLKLFYNFNSMLTHELQHSYDDYRSGGMTLNTKEFQDYKKKYYNKINNSIYANQIDDLESLRKYLNLPHEIWARFSQAMIKLRFYTLDFNEINDNIIEYKMYPINDVIKRFGYEYDDFGVLSPEMKRRLIRKVAQFWHLEQERVLELNKKEREKT